MLATDNANVMDCKGLFVLDKIHGKSPEDIAEEARAKLVATMKGGQWLQLEMGKAAPGIGEISSEETFPGAQLLLPNFGKNEELFAKFVKEEEKESGIFVPKGDWCSARHARSLCEALADRALLRSSGQVGQGDGGGRDDALPAGGLPRVLGRLVA